MHRSGPRAGINPPELEPKVMTNVVREDLLEGQAFPLLIHLQNGHEGSWGTSTLPMAFMRFLPSFCFSSSLRLREISPP